MDFKRNPVTGRDEIVLSGLLGYVLAWLITRLDTTPDWEEIKKEWVLTK